MGSITINSNLASLNAQRRFASSSAQLNDSFTRLSSGLRINKARDDASGLAISEDLKVDAHVFHQAIRNVNDSVGLLNIAEGAAQELTGILIRQRELASQSANGTLSQEQRQALHEEASALVNEYNRIVGSTKFNGQNLLDGTLNPLRVQAGYGDPGSIQFSLGGGLSREIGDGTYEAAVAYGSATQPHSIVFGDLNGDNKLDLVLSDRSGGAASVFLGNGDGTLKAQTDLALSGFNLESALADLDGDGDLDIVSGSFGVEINFNDGSGSFAGSVDIAPAIGATRVEILDVTGDGVLDIVATSFSNPLIYTFVGNGDGSFRSALTTDAESASGITQTGDFNNDGLADLIRIRNGDDLLLYPGQGDGTFGERQRFVVGTLVDGLDVADFDLDGNLDVALSDYTDDSVRVLFGNGDGTFRYTDPVSAGNGSGFLNVADLNADGFLDFIAEGYAEDTGYIFFGNGDGTFRGGTTVAVGSGPYGIYAGDLNGDGVNDLVSANYDGGDITVMLANTETVTTLQALDLTSRERSLEMLGVIDDALERVSQELASIGAAQSRLATAVSHLAQGRENFIAAASQITDVDVAEETARLTRASILQQAGAAVLAQANRSPELALLLLG
ncbi:MAG: VCBS repeat-containing protein [Bdellovibrionales bacterium]|nr:VCBS repeat-containing protein [Bdellovibrionales bacterium]